MRGKKLILPLIFLLLFFSLLSYLSGRLHESAKKGYTEPVFPAEWQNAIITSANREIPKIYLDGERILPRTALPYVTAGPEIMIPIEMIRDGFRAMTAVGPEKVYVFKGTHRLILDPDKDEVTVGSETSVSAGAALRTNGTVYISASLLASSLGLRADADIQNAELHFETSDPDGPLYPESFSYAEVGKMPRTLDQGSLGTCFAFASLSALESALLPEEPLQFSRDHMILSDNFGGETAGGETGKALAYLLSWQGPVVDEKDVYGDGQTDRSLLPVRHIQRAVQMIYPSLDEIKEQVFLYGGVEATMYLVMADEAEIDRTEEMYNRDAAAYCCTEKRTVNHDVVVVGWDDRYPKEHFPAADEIEGDGAFLCLNSWGEQFGTKGLFYVSYYDRSFAANTVCFTGVEPSNNYAAIYQSDLAGVTGTAGYHSDTAWCANVYTARSDESLAAFGFYALGKDTSYEAYLVRGFDGPEDFRDRIFLTAGSVEQPGYVTIPLEERAALAAGDRFAILLKITTPGSQSPIAIERVTDVSKNIDLTDGEGYLSASGEQFRSAENYGSCNVCLKVYTKLR